jgi:NAD(P)-dependent dehydrogenase (short-subunit alcohol dehydrogenase family)
MSKVAVVSGGASGIGAAISRRFARRGDRVVFEFDEDGKVTHLDVFMQQPPPAQ